MFESVSIDKVRGYWNSRPCNIKHSPEPIGTRAYFEQVAARKYLVEPHIVDFAEFSKWRGKKVLEIGCGIGTDTMSFACAGAQVTAVDLSEESLNLAKKRSEIYGVDVRFYQANCEELSKVVPIEEYDLVYSFGVLHHTPHPERAIEEIKKYMGPHSALKLMVYNRHSWKVLWMLLTYGRCQFWKLDEIIARNSEAQTGCPVTYSYTEKTLSKLLEGFDIGGGFIDHIFPYCVPEYKKYQYKRVWYFRFIPKFLFRWLERNFGWHICVIARAL